jgi:hypothetical protein
MRQKEIFILAKKISLMDWILKEAMEIELHTATMKRKDSY